MKAAATDTMAVITGVKGYYDASRGAYLPPAPYRNWREVVETKGLKLTSAIRESVPPRQEVH